MAGVRGGSNLHTAQAAFSGLNDDTIRRFLHFDTVVLVAD